MKDYLLIFRNKLDFANASPEQLQNSLTKWQKWLGELGKEKRLSGGQRLIPGGRVLTNAKKEAIDGPYSEGKEVIGGFQMVKAQNLEDAVDVARGCPIFEFGGSVEIRESMTS